MLQKFGGEKCITRIKSRPNFYYFDTAIKDDKKITVKYFLFTEDIYKAGMLANKIKTIANETADKL